MNLWGEDTSFFQHNYAMLLSAEIVLVIPIAPYNSKDRFMSPCSWSLRISHCTWSGPNSGLWRPEQSDDGWTNQLQWLIGWPMTLALSSRHLFDSCPRSRMTNDTWPWQFSFRNFQNIPYLTLGQGWLSDRMTSDQWPWQLRCRV